MARVRMVTRTINVTEVVAVCMETSTLQVQERVLTLTGDTVTADVALKKCKKLYENDELKVVMVKSMNVTQELYGMLETEFLKYAQKLDPETRKMLEDEE